ncbi:26703_t:CDS:2, partial [Gigaspora margarita]
EGRNEMQTQNNDKGSRCTQTVKGHIRETYELFKESANDNGTWQDEAYHRR